MLRKIALVTSVAKNFSVRKNFKIINFESTTHRSPAKHALRHLAQTQILKKHEQSHQSPVICEKCYKSFPTKYKYNEHQKTCSREAPVAISEAFSAVDKNHYPCDQCNKSYSKVCNLSRHIARIHDSNAQDVKQCDLCNEKLTGGHLSRNINSKHRITYGNLNVMYVNTVNIK